MEERRKIEEKEEGGDQIIRKIKRPPFASVFLKALASEMPLALKKLYKIILF